MRHQEKPKIHKRIVLIFAFISVIFLIFVHVAFSINAPYDWLAAKWTAGDMLTYVSTVALALLAVWQNYKMNEENETTQKRLEKIASHANELAVISKIIEIESDRLSRLKDAFDCFLANCDIAVFCKKMILDEENSSLMGDKQSIEIKRHMIRDTFIKQIDDSIFFLSREIRNAHTVDKNTKLAAIKLHYLVRQLAIDAIEAENFETDDIKQRIEAAKEKRKELMEKRELIIREKEEALDKVLYENLTLQEIRDLFQKKDENKKDEEKLN